MPTGYPGKAAATCHPGKPLHGKGLCNTCYRRTTYKATPRRQRPMATCHPDRPHRAYGLCYSCYQRDWKVGARARIPGKREKYNRKLQGKRYRLEVGQLQAMTEAQRSLCAACGQRPKDPLQIDHCHATGEIRGLLCRGCNAAAGMAGDDPARLRNVADYLERFLMRQQQEAS